ncbi:MAG: hypothetical protein ACK4TL_06200 [Hyphomicrobiaceae bacterium]
MSSTFDFDAQVAYVRDATGVHSPGEYIERCLGLARAVRLAIERYKPGEVPATIGSGIQLHGIDTIRAVRALKDFPGD